MNDLVAAQQPCELIENVGTCPACGANWHQAGTSREVAAAADVSQMRYRGYSIKVCSSCGLGFTSPVPSPASAAVLYEDRESANFDPEGGRFVGFIKDRLAESFARRLTFRRNVQRALDYSTGNGRYARALTKCLPKAKVVATDFHSEPPAALLGTGIEYRTIGAFNEEPSTAQFDLIVLRHVLEHSYLPREQLTVLRDRLSENGEIYIEVPNLKCSWASLAGRYFPGYYVPYHVFHFTQETLGSMLNAVGLTGVVRPTHLPLVGNMLSRGLGIKETFPVKLIGILLFPLQVILERIGGSSAICVRARRADTC